MRRRLVAYVTEDLVDDCISTMNERHDLNKMCHNEVTN